MFMGGISTNRHRDAVTPLWGCGVAVVPVSVWLVVLPCGGCWWLCGCGVGHCWVLEQQGPACAAHTVVCVGGGVVVSSDGLTALVCIVVVCAGVVWVCCLRTV